MNVDEGMLEKIIQAYQLIDNVTDDLNYLEKFKKSTDENEKRLGKVWCELRDYLEGRLGEEEVDKL